MLAVCFAGILALVQSPPTGDIPADTLSARAAAIEAEVVALTQQNDAMQAGMLAARAMLAADLSHHDRYHLGGLAFDAYMVAHINVPNVAALCEARRVARAMARLAPTTKEKASARGLVGQANSELAKLDPPGQCEPRAHRPSKRAPGPLVALRDAPPLAPGAAPVEPPPPPVGAGAPVAPASPSPSTPAPASTTPQRSMQASSPGPLPQPDDRPGRWTPRAWAGLGTAVLGAGLVAGMGASLRARWTANDVIVDIDRQVEADNRHLAPEERVRIHEANLRWHRLSTTAAVTGTVGAAALITGAVLMATGLRPRVGVSPWGDRTSAGLSIAGRF